MRLLDVDTLKLHAFYGDAIPKYAILSHRWLSDLEEVTFQQFQDPRTCHHQQGFKKIAMLCNQAKADSYKYAWIDSCCIDKTNSSELSEAINSMFAWYGQAKACYVYLSDVKMTSRDDFLHSKWWTRAWFVTLNQVLLPMIN